MSNRGYIVLAVLSTQEQKSIGNYQSPIIQREPREPQVNHSRHIKEKFLKKHAGCPGLFDLGWLLITRM